MKKLQRPSVSRPAGNRRVLDDDRNHININICGKAPRNPDLVGTLGRSGDRGYIQVGFVESSRESWRVKEQLKGGAKSLIC